MVRLNDPLGGGPLFPASNWWNQDISSAPVDPGSTAFIDFIGRTRRLHPDFGPPPYGIPYVGVGGSQPRGALQSRTRRGGAAVLQKKSAQPAPVEPVLRVERRGGAQQPFRLVDVAGELVTRRQQA